MREGKLTAGHARTLLGAPDPEALARELMAGGMTVRQAEQRSDAKKQARWTKPSGPQYRGPGIQHFQRAWG